MNRRIFLTLYLILFTGSFSSGMVIPLLPGYAHEMGADPVSIGAVFGVASAAMILCHPLIGRLSDIHGRKPFIAGGLLIGLLTSIGLVFSTTVAALILVRFAQGIGGSMVGPVAEAYAGDIVSRGKEGVFMGSLNTSLWAGFGCGPLIGGLMKDLLGIHSAFVARGALCLISLAICARFLPFDARNPSSDAIRSPVKLSALILDRHLMRIFLFRMSHYGCIGVVWAFCPLIGEIRFGLPALTIGGVITLGTVAGICLLPLFGIIADAGNKNRLLVLGGAVIVLAMAQFAFIRSVWELYSVSLLMGVGGSIIVPSAMAFTVIGGARHDTMGSVVSLMTAADNLGLALGPMLCGLIIEAADHQTALGAIGLMMACGVLILDRGAARAYPPSVP